MSDCMSDHIGIHSCGLLHIAEYAIEDVLASYFGKKITVDGHTYKVRQDSVRYQTFDKSLVCCCCGIVGTRMFLDTPCVGHWSAHFNLYAEWNGKLILMTKDHVIPRSKGGADDVSNMRTMCTNCNGTRGNRDVSLDQLYEMMIQREIDRKARELRRLAHETATRAKRDRRRARSTRRIVAA